MFTEHNDKSRSDKRLLVNLSKGTVTCTGLTPLKKVHFMLCNTRKPEMFVLKKPNGSEHLVPVEDAIVIISRLLNTPVPKGMCLLPRKHSFSLSASLKYNGHIGIGDGSTSLQITTDFKDLHDFNSKANCMSTEQNNCRWGAEYCLANLMAGKCKDPFIRETVGEILFPKHYAPQKQR